jgi:hypothetical protein
VRLHFADLPDEDVVVRAGFRVTTPLRSLVDIAASGVDENQLARAIGDAMGGGMLTIRRLRIRAEEIDPRVALRIERVLPQVEAS